MIEIRSVRKEYVSKKNRVIGVDNVSLTIQTGEVYGIVGTVELEKAHYSAA